MYPVEANHKKHYSSEESLYVCGITPFTILWELVILLWSGRSVIVSNLRKLVRFVCVFSVIVFTCNKWFSNSAPSKKTGLGSFKRLRTSHRNSECGKVKFLS